MNLVRPWKDLEIAGRAIDEMRSTTSFLEFEEYWENFLFRIERAWEGTERAVRGKPGYQQWHNPNAKLRKQDPLLTFLKQARNSAMHSVSDTVTKPLKFQVVEKSGRDFVINGISTTFENGVLTIDIDSPELFPNLDAKMLPTDPKLVRIKNRGKWFNPPKEHLGNKLKNLHPVSIAHLGLDYYSGCVEEAEYWLDRAKG